MTTIKEKKSSKQDLDDVESGEKGELGKQYEQEKMIEYENFEDMGLSDDLLKGVFSYGFERPSYIQKVAIKQVMSGKDIIAQAQSGTGKTGTFTISTLQMVDPKINKPQVLVIEPTRELAIQVSNVYENISSYMNIKVHTSIGGVRPIDEERIFRKGVHVVVGTTGRIYDMIKRRYFDTSKLRILILDEADRMLDRGFLDDIKDIFHLLPGNIQVGLFSATMPVETLQITEKFMNQPIKIIVKKEEQTLEGILQFYVDVEHSDHKYGVICDLVDTLNVSQAVIFCSTINKVDYLVDKMSKEVPPFPVAGLHGDMGSDERNKIMSQFRSGDIRFLITTDLVARGIDVQGVSVVINHDLPNDRENYIHRIGRAGRFGRKGIAISLVTERDIGDLRELERFYDTKIEELPANISSLI